MTMPGLANQGDGAPSLTRVPEHVWQYAQDQESLANAARDIQRYLQELADRASIRIHTIESRAKSLSSYQAKSEKRRPNGELKYSDPQNQIHDCVAARVIVFTTLARNDLADLIESHTSVRERQNPGEIKHNGYDSEHLVLSGIKKQEEQDRYPALASYFTKYRGLEIQVRSVAGHAWAEYEHDIRYKSGAYQELNADQKAQVDQWFMEAGGLRRFMDELFGRIEAHLIAVNYDALSAEESEQLDEETVESPSNPDDGDTDSTDERILDNQTLRELIVTRFSDYDIGEPEALTELAAHLSRLEIATVGDLESALANIEAGQVEKLMDYPGKTTGVRRLDDELLAVFTDRYVESASSEDRQQFLRLRLRRVRGKFALYALDDGSEQSKLMTAARAVREVARAVATIDGRDRAVLAGVVGTDHGALLPSAKARLVRTVHGPIYVASNLTRSNAEFAIESLLSRTSHPNLRIYRAGDLLFKSGGAAHDL